jgi:hypothetical protein
LIRGVWILSGFDYEDERFEGPNNDSKRETFRAKE